MSERSINFARVDDRVYRGGRPNAEQAHWLYDAGVRTMLNLEWEQSDDLALAGLDIRPVRIADFEPLPWFLPSLAREHVDRALAAIAADEPVIYIHCRSGQNRTGVVIAAYRLIVLRQPLDDVLRDFKSYRGFWTWGDERFIRELAH